ncbi:MAG: pyruvate-formate lyase [Spirochaetes bacterium]|nr:pyruvate-formate lyase [Spirochaetota bacterium]
MKLTPRLEKIKKRLFTEDFKDRGTWYFDGVTILTDDEIKKEPLVVRKALALEYIASNLPAYIKRDELIVGNPNLNSVACGIVLPLYATEKELEKARLHSLDQNSVWGHHPPKWNDIIKRGLSAFKEDVGRAFEREYSKKKPSEEALDEYRAMIFSLNAVIRFANRHAAAALGECKNERDPVRKKELFEIFKACSRVPEHPAATYQEALQSYWFAYCMINSGGEFIPLARGDQYLFPYFHRDLEKGRITNEEAIDLTGSFLAKCNERVLLNTKEWENYYTDGIFSQGKVPDESVATNITGGYEQRGFTWKEDEDINSESNFNYGQSANDWLMNFVVGGLKRDGTDGTNELSYLIIDLMHDMELIMPTLAARVHKKSPDEYLRKIAEVLRFGQGEPAIYNDDAIIPGFVDMGVPLEDAREYSNDGCWEVLVPGKSYFSYAHVLNLRCLEWVFTRGKSILREGLQEGLDTGDPAQFESFEEFYSAYKKQVDARIDFQCHRRLENLGMSNMIAPDPLMSALMDDCVKKGKDITQDGTRYIFQQILVTGLSHTVDSLAVVKKLVYEEGTVGMEELVDAVTRNWEGHTLLWETVRNRVPKFGNDDEYVDDIAVWVLEDFETRVGEWNKKQDKVLFPCGIGTFENYAFLGRGIGASADGRTAGDALAPNFSPSAGFDVKGPTAAIKSITKPALLKYFCGCPLDLSVNSNEFEGEAGIERMAGLIRSYCDLGGQILTITSCNVETLKDAVENPQKHQSLRVRMGGLSAYFVNMAPVQQQNIIKRFQKSGAF